ncbi:uncharacterized protein LOC115759357 [Drosophila novamexicana]|uniref:uncharacterized protein LOC115759357 n=1 Tax=Drosophila novamexicana TaxID=47314 RepID=UPI0011E5E216|nr:uncharacterized protein LOC115759357 [Drosophila novamexicana]
MVSWLWFWLCLGLPTLVMVHGKTQQPNFRIFINEFAIKLAVKDLFEEANCEVSRSRFVNCNMILRRNVNQVDVVATLDILKTNNKTMRLFNVRLDGCQFFDTLHKNLLFNVFAKSLTTAIHGSLKCPVISHFNYTLNNWSLEETEFPNYMPECLFKADLTFLEHDKSALHLEIDGRIKHKN